MRELKTIHTFIANTFFCGILFHQFIFRNYQSRNKFTFIGNNRNLIVVDDQLYGLPTDCAPRALYYNKTMLKELGLEDPNELEEQGKWDIIL